jgi:RNA polymerase sigma factor (sigma-70 family)
LIIIRSWHTVAALSFRIEPTRSRVRRSRDLSTVTHDLKLDATHLDLFLAHRSALIDYAAPIVGCRMRAEDVVQEAYIRFSAAAHQADASQDRIVQPVSYLYRIVRNLALDWARRPKVEAGLPDAGSVDRIPAPAPSPERAALYRDELRVVADALAELPERTRIAFEMHRLGGHPLRQVAARLGISVGLAHQLVRDALTHCAERLGDLDP